MTYRAIPNSTWPRVARSRFYLSLGYSALRVAELTGVPAGVATRLKREVGG